MTVLPGAGQPYPLKVSLQLIDDIEKNHGSLYQIAAGLLDKSLPLSALVTILKTFYRHAGCKLEEAVLDDFLLGQPCTDMLASVLLDIFGPIDRMEAAAPPPEFLFEMIKKFPDIRET
jgi:hypothetical protein